MWTTLDERKCSSRIYFWCIILLIEQCSFVINKMAEKKNDSNAQKKKRGPNWSTPEDENLCKAIGDAQFSER